MTVGEPEETPLSDDEFSRLLLEVENLQLATDQHAAAEAALKGRTVTCAQGGDLLGVVRLGLMKRMVAFGVLRGRISDLPHGLPALLRPLSGQILHDVGQQFGGDAFEPEMYKRAFSSRSNGTESTAPTARATPVSPVTIPSEQNYWPKVVRATLPERRHDWADSVERLRSRMINTPVPDAVYLEVRDVFDALGLGELPARQAVAAQVVDGSNEHAVAVSMQASPILNVFKSTQLNDPGAALLQDEALGADLPLPGQVFDDISPRSGATSEESV